MAERIEVAKLFLQLFSATGDGMNLELCAGTPDGRLAKDVPYPIATFRADTEGQMKFEVETLAGIVSFPLRELERAIGVARGEVHSEDFYDD